MAFKGFNLKYPEYEVITPQTKQSFHLRSLSVQEEERLKGSLITPTKISEHLNKCIYESMVKKPQSIKDLETFLKKCTMKDRDALIYGLYHITYEEVRNYDITCSACNKQYSVTIQASSTFNMNPYPGKDIFKERIKVKLPMSKGVVAVIKQPSLWDELQAIKSLASTPGFTLELITETLLIDEFKTEPVDGSDGISYTERGDVIDAYKSLPARDKRVINEEYYEKLGKFSLELKMKSFCTHCGNEEDVDLDLVSQFFRMVYSA